MTADKISPESALFEPQKPSRIRGKDVVRSSKRNFQIPLLSPSDSAFSFPDEEDVVKSHGAMMRRKSETH